LKKFAVPRHAYRTLVFLQLDHIGGVNTLLYTLANGGTAVASESRSPKAVCESIARYGAQLLPTSPTFLNLLLLSEEYLRHDLTTLELITYGTEPMPESTLKRVAQAFPQVRLLQTYGLSELGILRSQSRSSDSLWVRVGGEGFETKVVDNRLWIRAESAMLGYLNAPSPFDSEGFFDTGDLVEVDGEWIRFCGRHSDVINVGGSKVFPAEVESVLLDMPNVADAAVVAEKSPITGNIVTATVRLIEPEPLEAFKTRMRAFCTERLSSYKIPARVRLTEQSLHSERFKRRRLAS
jgi:acyl-coenzyme A synthetase/AMP-(fatty) acid ligase